MKRMGYLSAIALAAMVSLTSGCTSWTGKRAGESQQVTITMDNKNFKVLRSGIQGQASCQYLFPRIGLLVAQGPVATLIGRSVAVGGPAVAVGGGIVLGDPMLYSKAFGELRKKAELVGKSAHLYNIVQEDLLTDNIVIGDQKLTLTADVIQFTDIYRAPPTKAGQ
jgi:hypothetical protein